MSDHSPEPIGSIVDRVLAELTGGPFHGQRYKLKAGPVRLALTTRKKRRPKDRPPVAIYARDGDAGPLAYRETIGDIPADSP